MNLRPLLFCALAGLLLPACERIEEPVETKTDPTLVKVNPEATIPSEKYQEDGLTFEYPSGWKVLEDSVQESVRYVFIESPDEALSVIQVFSIEDAPSLEDFSQSYSAQTQVIPVEPEGQSEDVTPSATPQPEFMAITRDLDGKSYEWIVETIPSTVAGIDSSDYREYFRKDSERFSAFLINQVNKDALNKHEGSFEMIFRTLKPMQ